VWGTHPRYLPSESRDGRTTDQFLHEGILFAPIIRNSASDVI
jgi:hypothetical protein